MRRFVVLVALVCAACASTTGTDERPGRADLVVRTDDGAVTVSVEIADTPEERATGLMNRTSLAPEAGMAFLWPAATRGSFWMKNTLIPLSIAFWDEGGRIVAILDMEPCRADACPSYDPGVPFAGAVEVRRGFFAEHAVQVGDRVELRSAMP